MTPWQPFLPIRRRRLRKPGDGYHGRMLAVAWACYLGANTPERLAREKGKDRLTAHRTLKAAARRGYVTGSPYKPRRGPMGTRYEPVPELVQEWSL